MNDETDVDDVVDVDSQSTETKQPIEVNEKLSEFLKAEIAKATLPLQNELRGLQGKQDKQANGWKEFMDEFKTQKAKGLNDVDAETAAEKEIGKRAKEEQQSNLLSEIAERVLGKSSQGNSFGDGRQSGSNIHEKVIRELGLKADDLEVVNLVKEYNDPVDFSIRAGKLAVKKQSVPMPDESNSSVSKSGDIGKRPATEELQVELKKLMLQPSQNQKRIKELKASLGW